MQNKKPLPFSEYSTISTWEPSHTPAPEPIEAPLPKQMRLILWPVGHINWNEYTFEPLTSAELARTTQ